MDTPIHDVEWLLRIDDAYRTVEAKAQGQAVAPPPAPSTPRIS